MPPLSPSFLSHSLPFSLLLLLLLSPHSTATLLPAPISSPGNAHGYSVSISNDLVFVSSPPLNTVAVFSCSADNLCTSWANLTSGSQDPDQFGFQVATWQEMVVIGAPNYLGKGLVFIYKCNDLGCQMIKTLDSETPIQGGKFGCSVAVAGDRMVVGACGENGTGKGRVYLFKCPGFDCEIKSKMDPWSISEGAGFGTSVAISGEKVFVGAPMQKVGESGTLQGQVFLYDCRDMSACILTSTIQNEDGAARDHFGTSLAVSGDLLVVGAPQKLNQGSENAGVAYLFTCDFGGCTQKSRISASDSVEMDLFGTSVSIEGTIVIVGTPGKKVQTFIEQGAIYGFDCSRVPCGEAGKMTLGSGKDRFGYSISLQNSRLVVGAPQQGDNFGNAYFLPALCPSEVVNNTSYQAIFARNTAMGVCLTGYYASAPITRHCDAAARWDEVEGPPCEAVLCLEEEYLYATWNTSLAGFEATGTCLPGCYSRSTPTRACIQHGSEGNWNTTDIPYCTPCPPDTYLVGLGCRQCPIESTSPSASPSIASCICPPGNHVEIDSNTCEGAKCPAQNLDGATWPQTFPDRPAVGVCDAGYSVFEGSFPSLSKTPSRKCTLSADGMEGDWLAPQIPCEPTCVLQDCVNNGTCLALEAFSFCMCPEFYRGKYCELSGAARCIDDIICLNGGECIPGSAITAATCDCSGTLYTGSLCQTETVTCHPNPCQNNGVCQKLAENTVGCLCQGTGFTGERCELDGLDCVRFGCQNGGFCDHVSRRCDCESTAFKGAFCEAETVECAPLACSNNGECTDTGVNTISCACPSGFYGERCEINLIILIVVPAVLSLSVLAFFILRRYYPDAQNGMVISVTLTLYDFATDCLFVYTLSAHEPILFVLSLVFLVLPILFYLLALIRTFVMMILTNPDLGKWVNQNYAVVATTLVLSLTNIEMFSLLQSRLLYKEMFNAPLGDTLEVKLQKYRLVGILIEDIPQLILQSLVASRRLDTITLLSIMASVLTLVVGLVKRGLILLVERSGNYQKHVDVELDQEQESQGLSSAYTNYDSPETK